MYQIEHYLHLCGSVIKRSDLKSEKQGYHGYIVTYKDKFNRKTSISLMVTSLDKGGSSDEW